MSNQPIQDPLETEPPRGLVDRKIVVRPGEVTTFRLMHDPKDTDQARWFAAGERKEQPGNEVTYLVRGEETYAAMAEAIKLTFAGDATQPRIIYLLGWSCDLDIPLVSGDSSSSLGQLLKQASARGVEIRCMLWANLKGPGTVTDAFTAPQVKFINKLPTGRAILDSKTALLTIPSRSPIPLQLPIHTGSHHQKVLVTNGKLGLIAFCGGIDFSLDRLGPGGFQDVHCKVRGPAANDLLQLFVDRWSDYLNTFAAAPPSPLEHDRLTPEKEIPVPGSNLPQPFPIPIPIPKTIVVPDHSRDFLSAARIPAPSAVGDQVVQTGRTTPKGVHLRFRPQGEQSVRAMILKGIDSAQSFIYMEDQYILNPECADALSRAAAKTSVKHVTIVIPDDAIDGEFFGVASFHRAEFVKRLRASAGANKIQIFCSDRYVHSKIYIFDDKYAIIGSANCNRRGWEHDSEVVVGVFDESKDDAPTLHFAKRLRMKLWADHFNLDPPPPAPRKDPNPLRPSNTQDEYAELADGVASAVHWRKRAPRARIRPYFPADHQGKSAQRVLEEKVRPQLNVELEKLPASFGRWISLFNSTVEATPGLLVESLVWDHVLDPPSRL